MRPRVLVLVVLGLCLAAALGRASYRLGDRGPEILALQEGLARLGYFSASPTGYYGQLTCAAVKSFQRALGLAPDGIAGAQTLAALDRVLALRADQVASRGGSRAVALLPWDMVDQLWRKGTTARVYDVESGVAFVAWRLYGSLHADVEPLTKADTALLKQIYGGRWSWARRAVIVELNGRFVAGSMNGMPHGQQGIYDNDFPGQFCIHFLGSRLHKNRHIDADHQAMVLKAAQSGLPGMVRPAEQDAFDESPDALQVRAEATFNPPGVE
ncbi:MAG: peptidoglycan-binding domain-containing protein [Bacteroidota bacterium]